MKKILVVDDERPISDIIKFNLTKEGYEVVTAFDGREALEQFEAKKPDLVILDLMLPELDGLEVAKEIRKTSHTPIIMLSAKDSEFDKVIGLEIGADDYVTKPFSNREFELLFHLATHMGQVMTREHLLETVWGYDYFGDVRTVDVTIRRLREKIEDTPSRPEYILTRRGVGYYMKNYD